jgi:hypothetical protein
MRAEGLFLRSLIRIMCKPVRSGENIHGLNAKLTPCFAKLNFGIKSQPMEYRFIDSDGSCKIMSGNHNVKVRIAQDGRVEVSDRTGFGGTDEREVACTEEFHESLNKDT